MDRFVIRASASSQTNNSSSGQQPGQSNKKKKEKVFKEKTVSQWKKDWIACEKTGDGLKIHCKVCRLVTGIATTVRGAVHIDPFVNGTTNVKKFAADRHERSKHHKAAYGM